MNQILSTKLKKNYSKKFFKLQFSFSILAIVTIILFSIFYVNSLIEKEKMSSNIISNYNIYRLYSNPEENNLENNISNNIFGIIEIPKINLYYPVFSTISDELLKIAPCKFHGENLENPDNICIAGHNYNNSLFFSNINLLSQNDEIILYDNLGNSFSYFVYDVYEVKDDDLSPVYDYDENSYELTLVTCNNISDNRIIVKSKQYQDD